MSLHAYRPRWDLVVLMLGAGDLGPAVTRLLTVLADARADVEAEDGKVLVVVVADPAREPGDWKWPFPRLVDTGAALHRRVGAVDHSDQLTVALYITDRYREIFTALRRGDEGWPMSDRDVVQWLRFINIQCPECGAPE